jgi:hypothetical protein
MGRKRLALNDRPKRSSASVSASVSASPLSAAAAPGRRKMSSETVPSSLDELQEGNDLTSRRSRRTSAALKCTSDGNVDEVGPVSCPCLISFMLLF